MKRAIISFAILLAAGSFFAFYNASEKNTVSLDSVENSPYSGGETTVFNTSREAFAKPLANLPTKDLRAFTFGNKIFNTNWVEAPASVTSLDGLGPTFNRVSCSACHLKDGRGRPPKDISEPMNSMLIRLSVPGEAPDGGPKPHPAYGGQLNPFGISAIPGEGKATVTYEEIFGRYEDGTPYRLRRPSYHFSDMAFGSLGDDALFSPRVAPAVFGLGLLEAIPEQTILGWADEHDENEDGISGRPNYVPDMEGKPTIGRYGWKANVASLKQQDSGAALGDMGITTSMNPNQNCPEPQRSCKEAIEGGSLEMSDKQLEKLAFYSQTLAPPARRNVSDRIVQRGAELFVSSQCASCHKPKVVTGTHEIAQLSNQTIQPFTDLLLHDMGEALADHRPDYKANGREWRTPPLWGLGLVETVNHHTTLLHDGRARNAEEAILWHGGEAEAAKEAFVSMDKEDRDALLTFLQSL